MEKKKLNIPQKGAARKWAEKLKKLREQDPPKELVDAINGRNREKKDIAPSSLRTAATSQAGIHASISEATQPTSIKG